MSGSLDLTTTLKLKKMKTIETIKNELTKQEIERQNQEMIDRDGIGLSETDIKHVHVKCTLRNLIEDKSKTIGLRTARGLETAYEITNENILQMLRDFYTIVQNKFVKDVIVSVGKAKQFSEEQMDVILEEITRYNKIQINF